MVQNGLGDGNIQIGYQYGRPLLIIMIKILINGLLGDEISIRTQTGHQLEDSLYNFQYERVTDLLNVDKGRLARLFATASCVYFYTLTGDLYAQEYLVECLVLEQLLGYQALVYVDG